MERKLSFEQLQQEVNVMLDKNDVQGAINICSSALKLEPLNPKLYEERAKIYFISGDVGNASTDIARAALVNAKCDPSQVVIINLADAKKSNITTEESKLINKTIIRRLIDCHVKSEFDKIIEIGKEAENQGIMDSLIFLNIGIAYTRKKCFDEAYLYFEKALAVNPNDLDIYYQRTIAALAKQPPDFTTALQDMTEIINRDETQVKAFINRACIFFRMGKYEEAKDDCLGAIQLDENCIEAYYTLAKSHHALKSFHQAIAAAEVQISLNPNIVEGYCICTIANQDIGNYLIVIELCNKALEIDQNVALLYGLRSYSYMAIGKLHEATQDYNEFSRLDLDEKDDVLQQFNAAKLRYKDSVFTFTQKEPKTNFLGTDRFLLEERVNQFKQHEENLQNIINKTPKGEYFNLLFTYCTAELYAKCRFTFLNKFAKSTVDYVERDKIRIEKAARYYIIAMTELLNSNLFNEPDLLNKGNSKVLNKVDQRLPDVTRSSEVDLETQRENVKLDYKELLKKRHAMLLYDVIIGIARLYGQSVRSFDVVNNRLPENFRDTLRACLVRALPIINDFADVKLLHNNIDASTKNILNIFDLNLTNVQDKSSAHNCRKG